MADAWTAHVRIADVPIAECGLRIADFRSRNGSGERGEEWEEGEDLEDRKTGKIGRLGDLEDWEDLEDRKTGKTWKRGRLEEGRLGEIEDQEVRRRMGRLGRAIGRLPIRNPQSTIRNQHHATPKRSRLYFFSVISAAQLR